MIGANHTVNGSRLTSCHSKPSDTGRSEAASSISSSPPLRLPRRVFALDVLVNLT